MANVNSIAQLSEAQIAAVGDEVLALSTKTGQGPTVLAQGLYDIYSSGFAGAEGLDILTVAADAANAGLTTTDVSARVVTATLNAFGQGADMAQHNANVLFKIVDQGVITFDQLANNMGRTLPMANALGIGIEELGAGYSLMTLAGVSAAETETQLAGLMKSAINPTEDMTAATIAYGYANTAALIEAEGFAGFLKMVTGAAGGSEEKLFDLVGTQEAFNAALILGAGDGANYIAMLDEMMGAQDGVGATQMALDKQMESTAFKLRKLSAMFDVARIKLGQNFKPAIDSVIGALTGLLTAFIDLPSGIQRVIAFTTAAVGGFALLAGGLLIALPQILAMRAALMSMGGVSGILKGVTAAIRRMTLALLANPVILAATIAAFAGILAYKTNFLGFGDAVRSVFSKIADVVDDVINTFNDAVDAFMDVWDAADDVTVMFGEFGAVIDGVGSKINVVSRFLYSLGAALSALGLDRIAGWVNTAAGAIDELVQRFQGLRALGLDPVSAALIAIGTTFESLAPLMNDLAGIVSNVSDAFSAFVAGDYAAGFTSLGEAARSAWDALREIGDMTLDVVVSIGSWIIEQAGDLSTDIQNWLRVNSVNIIGNIAGIVVNVAGWVKGAVEDIWGAIKGWVFGGGNQGDGTGGATNAGVGGRSIDIAGIAINVTNWARGKIDDLWTAIKGFVVGGTGSVEHIDGQAIGGPNAGAITVSDVAVNIANWVKGTFPDLWSAIKSWVYGATGGSGGGIAGGGAALGNAAGGGVSLQSVLVNILSWARGTLPDVYAEIEGWLKGGVVYLTDVVISVAEPTFEHDWPALTSKDFWLGKPGTWLRDLVDGEPAQIEVLGGATIAVGLPDITWDWPTITSKDFWFGKPGTWLRNLMDSTPATRSTSGGGEVTIGEPTFLQDWESITSKDFWFGKSGTWLRDLIDGDPASFTVGSSKVNVGMPDIVWDWPPITSKDFWLGKPGTWLRDLVDGGAPSFDLGGASVNIGMPDIGLGGGTDADYNAIVAANQRQGGASGGGGNEEKGFRGMESAGGIGMFRPIIEGAREAKRQIETTVTEIGTLLGTAPLTWTPPIAAAGLGMSTAIGASMTGMLGSTSLNMGGIASSIATNAATGATALGTSLAGMLTSTTTNTGGMLATTAANMGGLASSVATRASEAGTAIATKMGEMNRATASNLGAMAGTAARQAGAMASSLINETSRGVSGAGSQLGRLAGVVTSSGGGAISSASALGRNIGGALASGLRSMGASVGAAAAELVAQADVGIRAAARMRSPSRLFMELGNLLGEGFAIGIDHMQREVARSAAALVSIPSGATIAAPAYAVSSSLSRRQDRGTVSAPSSGGNVTNYYLVVTKEEIDDLFDAATGFKVLTSAAEVEAAQGRI